MTTAVAETTHTLDAAALKQALADVAAAVPSKPPLPILAHVLLADGKMTSSNRELQIEVDIDYAGPPMLLPHARLRAILSESSAEKVHLASDGQSCVVTAGRGTWRLPVEDSAEWPAWPSGERRTLATIPSDRLAAAVRGCVYATDNEASRYALAAVLVDVLAGECSFVATDGRRLSHVLVATDSQFQDGTALVPSDAMESIGAFAARRKADVLIEATDTSVVATFSGCVVTARQIHGRYPKWRDVLPADRDGTTTTVVDCGELIAATRAAAVVASESSKGVTFTFSGDGISIVGRSSEYGTSDVRCDVISGASEVLVKMDPTYVCEWLKGVAAAGVKEVAVELVDSQSACLLRAGDFSGVVMPLAIE